jgi:hypothetical protein
MSSTHLSLYYHLIFSTHNRVRWIDTSRQEWLCQYIDGIIRDIEGIAGLLAGYLCSQDISLPPGLSISCSSILGLRAVTRRFTPGYCSFSASGAE